MKEIRPSVFYTCLKLEAHSQWQALAEVHGNTLLWCLHVIYVLLLFCSLLQTKDAATCWTWTHLWLIYLLGF